MPVSLRASECRASKQLPCGIVVPFPSHRKTYSLIDRASTTGNAGRSRDVHRLCWLNRHREYAGPAFHSANAPARSASESDASTVVTGWSAAIASFTARAEHLFAAMTLRRAPNLRMSFQRSSSAWSALCCRRYRPKKSVSRSRSIPKVIWPSSQRSKCETVRVKWRNLYAQT